MLGFIICLGDKPPILLFVLESIDFDWAFRTVRENDPWGYVVGAVLIELNLKVKVTEVGLWSEP